MPHVTTLEFHRPKPEWYKTWQQLLNRENYTVSQNIQVCSNHFTFAQPLNDDPNPVLYMAGYPSEHTTDKNSTLKTERSEIKPIVIQPLPDDGKVLEELGSAEEPDFVQQMYGKSEVKIEATSQHDEKNVIPVSYGRTTYPVPGDDTGEDYNNLQGINVVMGTPAKRIKLNNTVLQGQEFESVIKKETSDHSNGQLRKDTSSNMYLVNIGQSNFVIGNNFGQLHFGIGKDNNTRRSLIQLQVRPSPVSNITESYKSPQNMGQVLQKNNPVNNAIKSYKSSKDETKSITICLLCGTSSFTGEDLPARTDCAHWDEEASLVATHFYPVVLIHPAVLTQCKPVPVQHKAGDSLWVASAFAAGFSNWRCELHMRMKALQAISQYKTHFQKLLADHGITITVRALMLNCHGEEKLSEKQTDLHIQALAIALERNIYLYYSFKDDTEDTYCPPVDFNAAQVAKAFEQEAEGTMKHINFQPAKGVNKGVPILLFCHQNRFVGLLSRGYGSILFHPHKIAYESIDQ